MEEEANKNDEHNNSSSDDSDSESAVATATGPGGGDTGADGDSGDLIQNLLMPKSLAKKVKSFQSPQQWGLLADTVVKLGDVRNNVRIVPHTSTDCWWKNYSGRGRVKNELSLLLWTLELAASGCHAMLGKRELKLT